LIVAIDGPAGAGKSTVARMVAKKLGLFYLDTGAMYRAFTLFVIEKGIPINNKNMIRESLDHFKLIINEQGVFIDGRNVSAHIRSDEVTENVSFISSLNFVRKKMVELQREIGKNKDIVVEGRDIGTVVFPDTKHKFYLDARIEERARRRLYDEKNISNYSDIENLVKMIKKRDRYDSTRKHSPLKRSPDATYIDSTNMSVEEVCNYIIDKIKEKETGVQPNGE